MPVDRSCMKVPVVMRKLRKKEKYKKINVDNLTRKTSKTVAETAALAGDLFYSCNIDNASEAQIVDAVHLINYSIDELISNILYGVEKSKLSYRSSRNRDTPTTKSDSSGITSIALWSILMDFRPSHHATRDLVVEAVLHNLVSSLIHKYFFKGGHFFGVGSEALRENLEIMLSKLVAGDSDPIAIQRWRSMSVGAVFQMNYGVDSDLKDQIFAELIRVLKIALKFPDSSGYEFIIHELQLLDSLSDIIRQARRLSFMIQHDIVSCQLILTIAPASSEGSTTSTDDALGTYAFGLQRIHGSDCTILIKPKEITRALLTT